VDYFSTPIRGQSVRIRPSSIDIVHPIEHSTVDYCFTASEALMKDIKNPYPDSPCFFGNPNNPAGLMLTLQETETEPHEGASFLLRQVRAFHTKINN
jgi:hypothetical protein